MSEVDFLLEIGVEELPPASIRPALRQLEHGLRESLGELRLRFSDCASFATPRRLTVLFTEITARQADYEEEAVGPPVAAAYDASGAPTKALLGFCRSRGVDPASARRVETARGVYVAVTVKHAGRPAAELLPAACARVVSSLSFPKTMRWIPASDFRFARPIRWLVALLDDQVLELEVAGLEAGRASHGHRFLHPGPVSVSHPTRYIDALAAAGVVADPRLRAGVIREQIDALAAGVGGRVVPDPELLDINNFLVEKPTALLEWFDAPYLELPREVIVTALREHQSSFAVEDGNGTLLPAFIAIRNGDDRNRTRVAEGYAAVLRARLEDARFYWTTDLKHPPAERVPDLAHVVWLEGMGSLLDKAERVRALAARVVAAWNPDLERIADRAALLSKTDLLSEMIGSGKEYAALEGVIGAYYAERHGEPSEVVAAIRDHVRPRFAGDTLPETDAGAAVAVADRVDSVVGCFLADKIPSGSEDPYGVRRSGNGVVRILIEQERHLDLSAVQLEARRAYSTQSLGATGGDGHGTPETSGLEEKLAEFWGARIAGALEGRGYAYDEVGASLGGQGGWADPVDAERRAAALQRWRENENFRALVIGFKRVANILRAASPAEIASTAGDPASLGSFDDPAEEALAEAVERTSADAQPLIERRDYDALLGLLLSLRGEIDTFFDAVMVNVEDPIVRRRRLGLLQRTRQLFDFGWDLSRVVVEG